MYVCSKVKNSQARTGHQRGMGGRKTDDDDTHERHTDTNKLTRHTASGLPHILSGAYTSLRPRPPCRPPQHSKVPRDKQQHNNTDRRLTYLLTYLLRVGWRDLWVYIIGVIKDRSGPNMSGALRGLTTCTVAPPNSCEPSSRTKKSSSASRASRGQSPCGEGPGSRVQGQGSRASRGQSDEYVG